MKTKSYKIYRTLPLIMLLLVTACSDEFLERPPKSTLVDANFFKNNDQVLAGTALLYNQVWFDYNDKASYNLGDFRGGSVYSAWNDRQNVEFNTTPQTPDNGAAWRAFYNVVGQSNLVIQNINTYAGPEVSEDIRKIAIAEARFMRGLAYRYIVMNWGPVPIIENNLDLLADPLSVRRNTIESVWEFITRDFRAAARDLPLDPVLEGRVTKWSAEGMLARTYLTRSGVEGGGSRNQTYLDSAKYFSRRVIELSGASLITLDQGGYPKLFEYPYDNNSETLFALQWVFAGPNAWGTQNSTPAYLAPTSELGNGDGWGGDKGATFWLLSLYDGFEQVDENTLEGRTVDQRLKTSFMLPGMHYEEMMASVDGALQPYTVPFNDSDVNFASIKKYVPGRLDATQAASQRYDLDTYMLRLAEMYLIYAEAALGNASETSDAMALEYFNAVHERAGLPPHIDPLTFEDIFEERMKEFAMEGMAWYDLVRLHYYNPELAYSIIGSQDRGIFAVAPDQMPDPTQWTIVKTSWDNNRYFDANSGNFRLPLPAAEVSTAPNLLDDPVDYYEGN